jgi:methylmalonyl-CoA mutase N-terminal domain/subunit
VADTVDPLGGSYFVEHLTEEIETRAQEYLDKIEAMGGALSAMETGYIQGEIQDSAYSWQRAADKGQQIVVGVNEFTVSEPTQLRLLKPDPAVQESQAARLAALRRRRDNRRVEARLQELEQVARAQPRDFDAEARLSSDREDDNLIPIILECVESYATLGEICGVLRSVFGEHEPSESF